MRLLAGLLLNSVRIASSGKSPPAALTELATIRRSAFSTASVCARNTPFSSDVQSHVRMAFFSVA